MGGQVLYMMHPRACAIASTQKGNRRGTRQKCRAQKGHREQEKRMRNEMCAISPASRTTRVCEENQRQMQKETMKREKRKCLRSLAGCCDSPPSTSARSVPLHFI
jgi:hypothetical protein